MFACCYHAFSFTSRQVTDAALKPKPKKPKRLSFLKDLILKRLNTYKANLLITRHSSTRQLKKINY